MNLISRKNFIIVLAAILVVAMGIMALSLTKRPEKQITNEQKEIQKIETQSNSDSPKDIEKDLNQTDLSNIDKELQDIDKELNNTY